MKLLQHVKAVVSFSNKRKRFYDEDHNQNIIESMRVATRLEYEHEQRSRDWGGDKKEEMSRERKYFEKDIALPLGPTYFRRAYRMNKDSFYILSLILKKELEK